MYENASDILLVRQTDIFVKSFIIKETFGVIWVYICSVDHLELRMQQLKLNET